MKHIYKFVLLSLLTLAGHFLLAQNIERRQSCGFHDSSLPTPVQQMIRQLRVGQPLARLAAEPLRECRIWVVADSTILAYFKADTNRVRAHIFHAYAEANIVTEKELGVHLNVVAVEVLRKPTPQFNYATRGRPDEFAQLYSFQDTYNRRRDVARDLTVLWTVYTGEPYGGVALGIANGGGYQHLPTTTLNQGSLLLHETGHSLGSPHTHNCSWPGGPIDVCNDPEGGNCYTGVKTNNVGTIMSYCPIYGMGGNYTYHPLCVDLMRRVASQTLNLPTHANAPSQAPLVVVPANGQTSISSGNFFAWRGTAQTYRYQVIVSDKADFSTVKVDTTVYGLSLLLGRTLVRNTVYYWRVRSVNGAGSGPWSSPGIFRTPATSQLHKPVILPVANRRTYEDQIFGFAPVAEAQRYEISIHRVSSTTEPLGESNLVKAFRTTATQFRVGDWLDYQTNPGSFRWRVRAISDSLNGPWSDDTEPSSTFSLSDKVRVQGYSVLEYFSRQYRVPTSFTIPIATNFSMYDDLRRVRIEVSESADFKTIALRDDQSVTFQGKPDATQLLSLRIKGLKPDRKYFFRITAMSRIDSAIRTGEFTTGQEERWKILNDNLTPLASYYRGLIVDRNNNKWLFGINGITVVQPDGSTANHSYESTGRALPNTINDLAQDVNGRIWAATSDGLAVFENNYWTTYRKGIFGYNVGGYIWYNNFTRVMSSPTGAVAAMRDYNRVLRFDGSTWQDITGNRTFQNAKLIQHDAQGGIWVWEPMNQRLSVYENGQWSIPSIPPITGSVPASYQTTDNLGRVWFVRDTASLVLSGRKVVQSVRKYVTVIDAITGEEFSMLFSNFLASVQVVGNNTYFFSYGVGFLEYDGQRYLWYNYPTIKPNFTLQYSTDATILFAVDTNGNPLYIESGNTLYQFSRNNFNGFTRTDASTGCSYTFRVGIATPPPNNTRAQVFVMDSTNNLVRPAQTTYQDGFITFSMPTDLQGSGYVVAYTLGNRFTSRMSDSFRFVPAFPAIVSGKTALCQGGTTSLTASTPDVQGNVSYKWQTGDDTQIVTVNTAGPYAFTATAPNGCVATARAIVQEVPLPVSNVAGSLSFCAGQTTSLTAEASGSFPFTFQWLRGSDRLGTSVSQTITAGGTYSLITTDRNGCSSASAGIIITEHPRPTVNIDGKPWFCVGQSTVLSGEVTGNNPFEVAWLQDANILSRVNSLTIGSEGNYSFLVKDARGCQSNTSIQITEAPNPTPVIVGNTIVCTGQSTPLSVSSAAGTAPFSFAWQRNQAPVGTAGIMSATLPGSYVVTVTDAKGCTGVSSLFAVTQKIAPEAQIVAAQPEMNLLPGGSLLLTANTGPDQTYQWSLNGTALTGANSTTFVAQQAGAYTVSVTYDGCTTTSKAATILLITSIEPSGPLVDLQVSPNPTPGQVRIRIEFTQSTPLTLTLSDVRGLGVQHWRLDGALHERVVEADISSLPAGMYILTAETKGKRWQHKLVKH